MELAKSHAYFNYLLLLQAVESEFDYPPIDSIENQLLNHVLINQNLGHKQLVGDLIQLGSLGSQATLHNRIKRLTKKGYLKLKPSIQDGRKKQVLLSKKSINHFAKHSSCIERAVSLAS
jgi:DNA-binding MarR family transcriptional regulator